MSTQNAAGSATATKAMKNMSESELGKLGEQLASSYLEKNIGLTIIDRNWTCSAGEADIVATDGEHHIHLVEVKTRKTSQEESAVYPEEAVDKAKQKRYQSIASLYLGMHALETQVHFGILALNVYGPHNAHVRYMPNAFVLDE